MNFECNINLGFPSQCNIILQHVDKPVPNATLQVTGAVGWRREGLVYKKNEVVFGCLS